MNSERMTYHENCMDQKMNIRIKNHMYRIDYRLETCNNLMCSQLSLTLRNSIVLVDSYEIHVSNFDCLISMNNLFELLISFHLK